VRAGAIQLNATDDTDRNLQTADRLVRQAAALGAELIALPETWTVLGGRDVIRSGAQDLDGEAITWARSIAAELGIDLLAGSLFERGPEGTESEKGFNTSVHVGPDGEVRAVYRKIHLFDVTVDGTNYGEADTQQAGEEIVLSALAAGLTLGMTICYDLRFPELYRILTLRGAEVIAVPAAFTLATTRDHWEVLVRARAIENQVFMLAPNQIGSHPGGLRSGGRSLIVDPWGVVLAGAPDVETAIVADLHPEGLREVRRRLPALQHRRPSAYAWESA
jgi:predicted amidohydrolase